MTKMLLAVIVALVACSCAAPTAPTAPTGPTFLAGTWVGADAFEPQTGLPTVGSMTWHITAMSDTAARAYTVDMRSTNPWWPVATSLSVTVDNPAPPGQLSGAGSYASPRACMGIVSVRGPVTATTLTVTLSGSDCRDDSGRIVSFSGHATLTKQP